VPGLLADISDRRGAGYWAAILGVAVVTAIFAPFQSMLSTTTVALAYLLVVLFVATVWGRWPAMVASVLAVLCFNFFFLPPIYTFTITDPQNWVALAAFLVTAITAGQLSERAKRRAAEVEAGRAASAYNRSLIEASLDPLVTIGTDGRIIDVNTATEALTGRPRDELIRTDFSAYFTEPERARTGYQQAWRAGFVRDHALELRHRDGHSTSVLYSASVYRDDRGHAIGVVAAARPIRTSAGQPTRARSDPDVVRGLRRFISFSSVLSAGVGFLGLAGWMLRIPVLKSVIPGQVVIKPNTTVCFVSIGLSLWLMRSVDDQPVHGARKLGGQLLAALTAAVGLLSLAEHLVGWDLGIDQLLFPETAADAIGSLRPGLMAPITSLDFLLLGLALLGLDWTISWRSRRYSPSQVLAGVAGLASIVGLLDFVLKSAISYTHIALQTAVTLCLISLAVVCARTERGVPALFVSGSVGGTLVRRLLPAAIVIPILIGALWWKALSVGLSSEWSGGTLMIVAMIALLGNLTVLVGFLIDRADVERRRAEGALHRREEELREAQRLARVGSWWWDPRTDKVTWSEELYRIVGRDPKEPPSDYHEHSRCYTAEGLARLNAAVQQALQTGTPYELDLELVRADGSRRSVTGRGEVERGADGQVVLVRGTVHDITERKQAEEALQRSADEIRDLYNHAPCGYHSLDKNGAFVQINDTELEWLGYAREDVIGKVKFPDLLAPRSLSTFAAAFPRLKSEGAVRDVEFDLLRRDGTILPVLVSATAITDPDGNYLMSRSMVYDMTERRRAEEEIRRLARLQAEAAELGQDALRGAPLQEVLDGAVTRVARALGVDYCNVAEMLAGRDEFLLRAGVGWKEGVVGRATVPGRGSQPGYTVLSDRPVIVENAATETRFAPLPGLLGEDVVSAMSVVISTAEGPYGALGAHSRRPRLFMGDEVNFLQTVANVLGMAIERRRGEERLRRVNRAHRALSTSNEALVRATDESALLQQICRIIVEEAGYRLCWVGYAEQDAARTVRPIAQAGTEEGYLKAANITWTDTERGRGPTGTCIRTGEIQIAKNIATDPRLAPWRADALRRGYASSIAIPLVAEGRPFGALTIYSSEVEAFGAEEVRLLTELAGDLGYGIVSLRTQAERRRAEVEEVAREREVAIGFRIQQMLLLDEPPRDIAGLRVAALTVPSHRIAGDFYHFFTHQDQSLDVIVADVMGKGIPAALLGAATKSHFTEALCHLMALSPPDILPEPREVVTLAHAGMGRHLIELESFVTLCYARVDLTRRRLDLVDCGHTGVIHVRAGTDLCEVFHGDNLPLGIREGEIYDQIAVPFEPGDVFLFYSDGVTEASNASGELFGTDRLMACVRSNDTLAPDALVGAIRTAVLAFVGSDRLTDDLSCVAVEVGERRRPLARQDTEIRSDLRDLSRAREFVRTFCRTLPGSPLDADRVAELELAVNEAASNVMKHAYHGRTDQRIHLQAEAFPDHLAVQLHHLGDPFDPSAVPPPSFDGSRESGFGVYLITRSVDDVRYYRDERGGNCIALVKRRKP
jgi:sigma-B regulation protein RsbU (phosphoserine phosphatase)